MTLRDHTKETRTEDGAQLWICSCCGAVERWSESWVYYGNLECSKCWTADIEFVACSEACMAKLCTAHGKRRERALDEDDGKPKKRGRKRKATPLPPPEHRVYERDDLW